MENQEIRWYLVQQAHLHPATQAQDLIKQCFQAAFGAGHLIVDEAAARRYLESEFAMVGADARQPLYEFIAPDVARVNLAAWMAARFPQDWLFRLFLHSAQENARRDPDKCRQAFDAALTAAQMAADAGELSVPPQVLARSICEYIAGGVRAVHHTQAYRAAEHPAYRVVSGTFTRLLPVFAALAPLAGRETPYCIAIDGRAASGKSTMAAQLSAITGAGVVHMDDFFLPPQLRTPQRLKEPGGNVDYERFAAQVLPGLLQKETFSYPRFNCDRMCVDGVREVSAGVLRIVEGSYSQHPYFGAYAALRIYSDLDPQIQLDRIRRRNGEELADIFRTRWIPMEEAYFTAFSIREKADLVL